MRRANGNRSAPPGSQGNEFDFAGQQTDGSIGLQYLRARYYDPATGVFLSRDALSTRAGWSEHPYAYASAAPTDFTDPSGLCSWRIYDCVDDAWSSLVDAGAAAGEAIAAGGAWTAQRVRDISLAARAIGTKRVGALSKAGSSISRAVWYAVRAAVNAQVSHFALAYAAARGATCRALRNGLTGCVGMKGLASSAMTIGNVVLVREKTIEDDLLAHEEAHADQWALFGLATPTTPLIGQAAFAASYGAFQAVFGQCGNLYEKWADLGKGGYEC